MGLKSRLQYNHRSDLLDRNVVFESKCEQELIAKVQLCDGGCKGSSPFGGQDLGVGSRRPLVLQPCRIELVSDEIQQVSAGRLCYSVGTAGILHRLRSSILVPVAVDAKAPSNHDEPGSELPSSPSGESAETSKIVFA